MILVDEFAFTKDLDDLNLSCDDVDTCVDQLESKIDDTLNERVPFVDKTKICRAPKPWFTEQIVALKQELTCIGKIKTT